MAEFLQVTFNFLIAGSHYVILAIGFSLIYSTAKFIHMTHGSFALIGGYLAFVFAVLLQLPLVLSLVFAVICCGLLGVCVELFVYQPLRSCRVSSLTLFIASLGLFTVFQAVIAMFFGSEFKVFPYVSFALRSFELLGAHITLMQIVIIISALIIWMLFYLIFYKTTFGKIVRAIRDDEEVAEIIGVPTKRTMRYVFFLGYALAGLSGVYVGFDMGIYPMMGLYSVLEAASGSIIGGIGSLHGSALGAYIVGFAEQVGTWMVGGEWKTAITMALLMIFLLVRPRGIFGN